VQVLSLMTATLALGGEVEDVVVTLSGHFLLVRAVAADSGRDLLVLLALDRARANLAMAHRELRGLAR
jgi:hypothetical protein